MDNRIRGGISIVYFPLRFADCAWISLVYIGRVNRSDERKKVGLSQKSICQFAIFCDGIFGRVYHAGSLGNGGFSFLKRLHADYRHCGGRADFNFGDSFYLAIQNQVAQLLKKIRGAV